MSKFTGHLKRNWTNLLLAGFLLMVLLVPAARVGILRGMMDLGLFRANPRVNSLRVYRQEAPGLVFQAKNGQVLHTTDLKGKVLFINFWATWCPPCLAEMPDIQSLYHKLKQDTRIVFILVDVDGNLVRSAKFFRDQDYDLPLYQVTGPIPVKLLGQTIPFTLILDSSGRIALKEKGVTNYDTPGMIRFLHSL